MTERALFTKGHDGLITPTEYASGPWDEAALHGGPVAALLARAVEAIPADAPLHVARLTVELMRPVPLRPLHISATITRPGRKVQLVDASIVDSTTDAEVARARALRIRAADVALPYDDPHHAEHLTLEPPPPGPAGVPRQRSTWDAGRVAFHSDGAEHRFVAGTWIDPGPVTLWVRLLVPLFEGERPTGLQRAVAAADFANGVAR
ncbi:MAG TPA: acyl-CoA thioesterase domain-containing protein, partial [Acidimicrobiales bacterium]